MKTTMQVKNNFVCLEFPTKIFRADQRCHSGTREIQSLNKKYHIY